ncbi:MAG: hypothetical protein PHE41_08105 [Eubacteriales bacterium]|nr:hypothetical protein [Eubacteriales bacterium]
MLNRLGKTYNSGGMDALIEALIDFVLEVRDDINRDEFMAAWKELEKEL